MNAGSQGSGDGDPVPMEDDQVRRKNLRPVNSNLNPTNLARNNSSNQGDMLNSSNVHEKESSNMVQLLGEDSVGLDIGDSKCRRLVEQGKGVAADVSMAEEDDNLLEEIANPKNAMEAGPGVQACPAQ